MLDEVFRCLSLGDPMFEDGDVSTEQVQTLVVGRWTSPDWLALRLLAVCALARSAEKPATRAYPGRSAAAH